jgi:hypothetical protein
MARVAFPVLTGDRTTVNLPARIKGHKAPMALAIKVKVLTTMGRILEVLLAPVATKRRAKSRNRAFKVRTSLATTVKGLTNM